MRLAELLRWTVGLVQLRATPADAPHSRRLLVQLLVLDLISSASYLEAKGSEFTVDALLGQLCVRLATIYLALRAFGQQRRFVQTSIALFAVSALLTFFMLPLASALERSPSEDADLITQILQLGWVTMLFWSIAVDGHVLRHALGIKFWYAVGLAFGLLIVYGEIAGRLFPTP